MTALACTPRRGLFSQPLPAPTSSTSKVTGLVLPRSVKLPSILPCVASLRRKAVDAIETDDEVGVAEVRDPGQHRRVIGIDRVGAGARLGEILAAHEHAGRQ